MSTPSVGGVQILQDPEQVPGLGSILGVWAHPDDEAYLAAGLMALSVRAGNSVLCVTATRGELGTSDPQRWPPDKLAEERTAELRRSLGALGVTEHEWLDYPDGGCAQVPETEAVERVAEVILRLRPRTVLTFGPDGMTGHSDHVAVSRWTTLAFEKAAPPGSTLHYATVVPEWLEIWMPIAERLNVMMDESLVATTPRDELSIDLAVPEDILAMKYEALRLQTTQTASLIDAIGRKDFLAWLVDERYRRAASR